MTTLPAADALQTLQREVQRLLGRCLLRLQQYEKLMKAIVAHHEITATGMPLASNQEQRIADAASKTLGTLVGTLLGSYVTTGETDDASAPDARDDIISIKMKMRLSMSAEDFSRTQDDLKELVSMRNDLVHHFIDHHDLWNLDGCRGAHDALTVAYGRIDQHFEQLRGWAEHMDQARRLAAEFYQSDIFRDLVIHGIAPDGSVDWPAAGIVQTLREAATELAVDGWTPVASAGRWIVERHTLAATDLIRSVCRQTAVRADNAKVAAKLASSGTVSGVERLARADRRHAATTDEWDADPWLLNTPGGVVDLKTGRQRPHERADRMTKVTTATPNGECPIWLQFIDEVTGGDKALQAYLQRMVGYALTGSTQEHALFFLYGTGANGKSVFVNTLATILGDYATNAPMDTFMETRTDRHPTDMAGLRGARFVAAIETEQGRRWAESKVKNLTGGDKISARFMRQDFFEFFPQFKLFVAGNHKPAIRNIDEAMKRRLHLIPFTITVLPERRDKHLQQKLLAERDGILAWAVQGCLDWQRHGRLDPPQRVVEATEEYFEAEDALGRWIEERCVREANAKSLTAELFNDWKQWAEAAGEFTGSQKRFADLLLTRGLDKWRNGMGLRGFQGVGLKYPPAPAYTPYADN